MHTAHRLTTQTRYTNITDSKHNTFIFCVPLQDSRFSVVFPLIVVVLDPRNKTKHQSNENI